MHSLLPNKNILVLDNAVHLQFPGLSKSNSIYPSD